MAGLLGDETCVGESGEEMRWIFIEEQVLTSSFAGGACLRARLRDGLASQARRLSR